MHNENYGSCRYCGQPILWIKTTLGRRMPLNPEELHFVEGGPEKLVTPDGEVISGRIDAKGDRVGYIAHFATCSRKAYRSPKANKRERRDR